MMNINKHYFSEIDEGFIILFVVISRDGSIYRKPKSSLKKKTKNRGKKIGVKSLAFLSIYLLLSSGKIQQKYGVNFQFI